MAITVTHSKVSTIPDDADTSLIRPSDWNDDHVLVGLGTAAELDAGVANGVATLDSLGKVPTSELPAAILGALNYQGTWNASTNTPTLTSSVGTKGYYYVVSVAGSTNLNGITDWQIGDWAVYNGSVWQKIDNTDAVTSVNGQTGVVVLTAADVSAVPYTGATGAVDLNAKSLTNVSNLGIGTTSVPTIKIRAIGDNNSTSRIAMRGYSSDANSSAIRVTKFRGTAAAPQAPQSGDSLGKFELAGYGTTSSDGYPQASFEGLATENWGATARGAKTVIKVTPNTTTTQAVAVTINQDKSAVFESTVTATSFSGSGASLTNVVNSLAASTGISVSGLTGAVTITNTAPDQTVALTAGTGISTSGTYPNFTITNTAPSSGGTVTSVTGTAPVSVATGTTTPVISMAAANTTTNGYLTSTDWNTFNGKSNTNGTVTSVAALTLGTTGTDLSSTVANGTTTPVITLQVPTASATNRGALSAADWTTFNGKAPALTYTTGYIPFGQGTTTPTQDSNLFWDNTNKRLGIGTASPSQPFELVKNQNGYTWLSISNTNAGSGASNGILFTNDVGALGVINLNSSTNTAVGAGSALIIRTLSTNPIVFSPNSVEKLRLFASGGLSLGNTTDPGATNLSVTGTVRTQGYTVAGLPAAGTVGRRAYVTDALAPTFLTVIVGGGAIKCPVFDNGTAWVAG
jgi:hypothetical protein